MQGQVDVGQQEPFAPAEGEITEGNHGFIVTAGHRGVATGFTRLRTAAG
jgi:hypothetical protein